MTITLENKKAYFDLIAPKYISWECYSSYLNYDIPFGSFGDIVDCRTYRRFIPELNKRETAIEAFLRVVEYNISLVKDILSHEELVKEAELMFKYLIDLKALPSNRSRWIGGTTSVEKHPASIMNCSFLALNRLSAFGEIFELLCLGVGVGYRTFYKDINQLPNIVNKNFEIEFELYNPLPKELREENTYKTFNKDKTINVVVGDSREGWRTAINILLSTFFYRTTPIKLIFNLNSVRPFGERIYGFGGTASGPEALENILHDIYHIIKNSVSDRLTALDASDICCAIAKGVVAGSSRRSALLCLFEENDDLMRNSKINIPFEKSYRWQANITCAIGSSKLDEFIKLLEIDPTEEVVYSYLEQIKPTKETLQSNFEAMKTFGEPGIDNYLLMVYKRYLAVRKYRPNEDWHQYIEVSTNPCFTGDMKLLTVNGYKTFAELEDQEVYVINSEGNISSGKVWCSGVKSVFQLRLSNNQIIKCTKDHVFKTNTDQQLEARDLKGNQLMPYLNRKIDWDIYDILGFIQGDGSLSRLNSSTHLGLEVHIGKNDMDILVVLSNLLNNPDLINHTLGKALYLTNEDINILLNELEFDKKILSEREFPFTYESWGETKKRKFLRGCFSANGSVLSNGRITYKSTCEKFIKQLQKTLLDDFNISSYITTNKSKEVEFTNGNYVCKESYDLNIGKYEDKFVFFNTINFIHTYKEYKLRKSLIETAPTVTSIKFIGEEKVYDFTESLIHWGVVEGYVVHNCHEIIGTIGLDHNSGGFCNLTTGDLRKCIDIKNKKFDYKEAEKIIRLLTRIGLRQTNIQIPMSGWNQTQLEERLLGVDISNGFIEVCSILNWKINSKKASNLRKKLREWANDEATKYSEKLGFKRPLLVTCVKPNGNTSTVLGSSAGIHWPWSKYYLRRVRMTSTDALAQTLIDQGYSVYPELYDLQKLNLTQESLDNFKDWNNEDQFDFYENQLKYFSKLSKEDQKDIINKCNAIVFEFPVKSFTNISANEITAIEQLENQRLWSIEYTDHLPSITITVKYNEWDSVCDWIYDNWNNGFITAAFMNYYDSKYSLLPYQSISEQEYNYHLSKIDENYIKTNELGNYFILNNELLDYYEQLNSYKDKEDLDIGECKTGCPLF